MPLPIPTNTTCDIYRTGHSPPAAPDVAGVAIALQAAPENLKATWNAGQAPVSVYDYIALMPLGTDIRDNGGSGSGTDQVYVPNKNGTQFLSIWVERIAHATGDYLQVFLNRGVTTFPTDNV
jgi:hypothetical protein